MNARWLVGAAGLLCAVGSGFAQCEFGWRAGLDFAGMPSGETVNAACLWDPDGTGPAPQVVLVAGDAVTISKQTEMQLMAWDGARWSVGLEMPVGWGAVLNAMTPYAGGLVVGGTFPHLGNDVFNNIAHWNGTRWQPLGAGMQNGSVFALAVHEGALIAGGSFLKADGKPASRVARWNGLTWQPLGDGFKSDVYALASYQGQLIAGGLFSASGQTPIQRLARWNPLTQAWEAFADSPSGTVMTLTVSGDELLVGGLFQFVGDLKVKGIARWNGQAWNGFVDANGEIQGVSGYVGSVAASGDDVYVGGDLSAAGGVPAAGVARWDGEQWNALGSGIPGRYVTALAVLDGQLFAGGYFSKAGGLGVEHAATWDGQAWHVLGDAPDHWVTKLHNLDGTLYAGGHFDYASGQFVRRFARWDDATRQWVTLNTPDYVVAEDAVLFNGQLVACGSGFPGRVAAYDGHAWSALGGGVPQCRALLVRDGVLLAAGEGVWQFDGAQWQLLPDQEPSNIVTADLAARDGQLIASGGSFVTASKTPFSGPAIWDGQHWTPLPGAGALLPSKLLTGPTLDLYLVSDANVYRWNHSGLAQLAIPSGAEIVDVAWVNGRLAIGGALPWAYAFTAIQAGNDWEVLQSGVDGFVLAMTEHRGDLVIGGSFNFAGDGRLSPFLARWGLLLTGDLDEDQDVDALDLARVLAAFTSCPGDAAYDEAAGTLDNDPCVNILDLNLLLSSYGAACQ